MTTWQKYTEIVKCGIRKNINLVQFFTILFSFETMVNWQKLKKPPINNCLWVKDVSLLLNIWNFFSIVIHSSFCWHTYLYSSIHRRSPKSNKRLWICLMTSKHVLACQFNDQQNKCAKEILTKKNSKKSHV